MVALLLNFFLPRLIPGNPVDSIVSNLARGGGVGGEDLQMIYENYNREFGLDKPIWQQFFIYLGQLAQGNLGTSFAQYPASVNTLVGQSLPWSIALQVPAILIGWIVGNILGAMAAFRGGWFDRGAFLTRCSRPPSPTTASRSCCCSSSGCSGRAAHRRRLLLRAQPRVQRRVLR